MSEFQLLKQIVLNWANDKGIFERGTPEGQALKTIEEANELLKAVQENDRNEIIDAIGDVLVTVIIQAEMQGLRPEDCLQSAYDVISKRTGRMVGGVFVKDEVKS
jgi:NTP pyrophosphatase (non-canonical NTP hydrolase)